MEGNTVLYWARFYNEDAKTSRKEEGIYYDLLTNQVGAGEDENLIQRAASKYKVIIVSPTSFLAYLQTVLQGLRALEIEKRAGEIQQRVGELGKHIGLYDEYYRKLGVALGTTVSHYNSAYKELGKIDNVNLRFRPRSVISTQVPRNSAR